MPFSFFKNGIFINIVGLRELGDLRYRSMTLRGLTCPAIPAGNHAPSAPITPADINFSDYILNQSI
jgi:hypothetical protein